MSKILKQKNATFATKMLQKRYSCKRSLFLLLVSIEDQYVKIVTLNSNWLMKYRLSSNRNVPSIPWSQQFTWIFIYHSPFLMISGIDPGFLVQPKYGILKKKLGSPHFSAPFKLFFLHKQDF